MHNILVVDDELSIRESFSLILEGKYKVLLAASGEAALKAVADQKVDMAYLDIRMPGMDGIETLKRLREINPELEIIMVTAVNDVSNASKAIKIGARDYVVKPFDVEHILKLTEQILRKKSILQEGSQARTKILQESLPLIGQNEKILNIQKTIDQIKGRPKVLVVGEKGTEKETVARMIHQKCAPADAAFRNISLSQEIPLAQIKVVLFGSGKGETAILLESKTGLIEEVKNGTLLIDNLEIIPSEIFSILSSSAFSREGSLAQIPIESQLVGGADPLISERRKEVFDFFSEILIHIPPLRERGSDIPLITHALLEKFNARHQKEVKISASALDALSNYYWPGNVDELQALIERLVLCSKNEISAEDLPLDILLKTNYGAGDSIFSRFENEYIRAAFELNHKDKQKSAAFLDINPFLLDSKIENNEDRI